MKRYVAGKIFIDAGAYHGESSLTLAAYNPGMILAFEISPRNFKILQRTLRRSGSHGVNIVPLAVGLGDTEKDIGILDDGSNGTRINRRGTTTVHVSSLDNVMQKYHEPVGFVKADLEGGAFDMLKGMREILLRDRPVLALYVYHSPEEFFGCFEYLRQPELNYHLEFQHHDISASLSEIALIGIPAELFS